MITSNVTTCIHQAFIEQAILHPNKVAITLDDQSLTYNQLLNQVRQLTFVLINDKGVHPGDIVCQYIDRSIEMIVGIMSIMMSGAVYAPLNPSNPLDRLELLVHQVDTKLILVNQMSLSCISSLNVPILDISEVIESYHLLTDAQIEELSKVDVTPDSISHIVFTSGSTGIPKAVQIRHRNFMGYIHAHFIQTNDVILQLASSSFDVHLDEINGALVRGAHLVLLKAGGHLDFDYVTKVIYKKNVTFVAPVPSWLNALGKFLSENRHAQERIKQVRLWYLGGEQLFSSTVHQFLPFVSEQCHILNSYGPAEITEAATFYEVRREELSTITSLPIGRPMTGYRIYLLDEYRQPVIPGQLGEIIVGGVGVFAGYYGRADLTSQVLIDINGEQCYATGDLARLDFGSGELMFIGRRDFQVKVRGQRIELSAIELVIIQSSPSVINCVVVIEDDGFRYVSETVHRYDIVFIDAFDEEAMPAHMNTAQFFLNISGILNSDGCLATNANLSTTDAFDRLAQTCCSTFESNVLFAHTNIIENAHVIISGTLPCLKPITSQAQAIHEAQELESDAMLEFSLSRLIALAYRGLLIDKDTRT
ncbi:unnamed protein product [Rotaria sordida]|uniref:AMP-dependent synthetase/ligase domain-containing protein n=1 Tax=Rotaria sordida TaxID=392033 RepID=A0A818V4D2_9BILA|nr:unnamed protein product [Rotaria sordida]